MALLAAAAGVIVCAFVCKDDGQKSKIQQDILNKINIKAVSNILIKEGAVTSTSNAIIQKIEWDFEKNCVPPEEAKVVQDANINAKVYNVVATKISQDTLVKVRAELTNQLTAAAKQVDKKLFAFLEKNMDADTKQTVTNKFKNTIEANVTVDTISKIFADNRIQQTIIVKCDGPMPSDFSIDQDAQITMSVINMINSTISQITKDDAVVKIFNPLYAKHDQEQTDFMSEFVDMFKKFGMLIVVGIIVLIVVIIVMVIIVKMMRKKGGSQVIIPAQVPVTRAPTTSATPRQS